MGENYKILKLQAKDLFLAMKYSKKGEYSYFTREGDINYKKFRAFFDYCLETDVIMKTHREVYRNSKNVFEDNMGNRYLTSVISVAFDYKVLEYNKIGNCYYRYDYDFDENDKFFNGIIQKNGVLLGIDLSAQVPPSKIESNLFKYNIIDKRYHLAVIDGQEITMSSPFEFVVNDQDSTKYLRHYLYENGFTVNGVEYVRYKRSSGASREGDCLFIDKRLYKKMRKWSLCGIDPKNPKILKDKVSFEAYQALSLSGLSFTIELDPHNVLILDDKEYVSKFKDKVANVSIGKVNKDGIGELQVNEQEVEVENTIFDGEGLLDTSIFKQYHKRDKGMMLLRNRYFKCCAFHTRIQKFFEDNDITSVEQLHGYTEAKDIKDIKLICTTSSLKYLKFATIHEWMENAGPIFGVVKTDKKTQYFGGSMVQTSYQLLNTLEMEEDEVKAFLKDSIDYRTYIREDPVVLNYYVGAVNDNLTNEDLDLPAMKDKIFYLRNVVTFAMMGINKDFHQTALYKQFREDLLYALKDQLLEGNVLVDGNYSVLFGNGYELLKASIGQFDVNKDEPIIKPGTIMSKRFENNEKLLCYRNSHITMGNIYTPINVIHEEYEKYFLLSKEIVCINSINQNLLQQLNGCDFDSDTIFITNNKYLLDAALKHENEFLVPFSSAEPTPVSDKSLAEIDHLIANNAIGEIVNLSQILNSLYWDSRFDVNKKELYLDIVKLAVLSNYEIDKAKRIYPCYVRGELNALRKKYAEFVGKKRPTFFQKIIDTRQKSGYEFMDFETTMDKIYRYVSEHANDGFKSKVHTIPFAAIVAPVPDKRGGYAKTKAARTISQIVAIVDEINAVRSKLNKNSSDDERRSINMECRDLTENACKLVAEEITQLYDAYLLLQSLSDEQYSRAWFLILYTLIQKTKVPTDVLFRTNKNNKILMPCYRGKYDYIIHGKKFYKR